MWVRYRIRPETASGCWTSGLEPCTWRPMIRYSTKHSVAGLCGLLFLVIAPAFATAQLSDSQPADSQPTDQRCALDRSERFQRFVEDGAVDQMDALRQLVATCAQSEVIELTQRLVAFQTVAAIAEPAQNDAFIAMSNYLALWSETHGLVFRISGEHDAYEIILAGSDRDAQPLMSFIAHCDVVPVNDPPVFIEISNQPDGWSVPPFAAIVSEDRLWGRGTEDDKGPIAATMVVMAMLKEAGFEPSADIVLAMGTGEEHAWAGMRRYAESIVMPRYPISIDSGFPVVIGESGFVAWGLSAPVETTVEISEPRPVIVELTSGQFLTQVPDTARMVLSPMEQSAAELAAQVRAVTEGALPRWPGEDDEYRVEVDVITSPAGEELVQVIARGRSTHSSSPEDGRNAMWLLAVVANELLLAPGGATTMLSVINDYFGFDHYGERLGIAQQDAFMGRLSVAATKLYVADGQVVLEVNMRRPRGQTSEAFTTALAAAVERIQQDYPEVVQLEDIWVGEPHFVDPSSDLVQALVSVYRVATGDSSAEAVSRRGSTYARLFPGAVSFGPSLPGRVYSGHGADEFVFLDALALQTTVVLEAILKLAFENEP